MAYIVMAYTVIAYIVMAYIVIARCTPGAGALRQRNALCEPVLRLLHGRIFARRARAEEVAGVLALRRFVVP